MAIIVQKYGGSSVGDVDRIKVVARRIADVKARGDQAVVVVSAMGDSTNQLLKTAHQVCKNPDRRELDMLLSCGERMTMSLLSMAVKDLGHDAISFTGSQCGIMTNDNHFNARIVEVRPFRIQDELDRGRVVIVAGYQGTSYKREVTTLGRGGSDTTAVALAAALDAQACEIYSDVDGVYSGDPKVIDHPLHLEEIGYDEMAELARCGAKVLNEQAVEFARRAGIAIYARATAGSDQQTVIRRHAPVDGPWVLAVTGRRGLAQILVEGHGAPERFLDLASNTLPCQSVLLRDPSSNGLSCCILLDQSADTLPKDLHTNNLNSDLTWTVNSNLGTVSVVGPEIGRHRPLVAKSWKALVDGGVTIRGLWVWASSLSFLVDDHCVDHAQKVLHGTFIPPVS